MANGDGGGEAAGERVARLYGLLRPHLDERQRRLLLGAEALELGRGGIKAVARATGVHPDTVGRGVREAEGRPEPRVRAPGGGRKKLAGTDPGLAPALRALVDPATRWCRWTPRRRRRSASSPTAGPSGGPGGSPSGSTCTTSRPTRQARRSPTAFTTWAPTPGGFPSAPTTTPPRSPRRHCAAGGGPTARPATRTP